MQKFECHVFCGKAGQRCRCIPLDIMCSVKKRVVCFMPRSALGFARTEIRTFLFHRPLSAFEGIIFQDIDLWSNYCICLSFDIRISEAVLVAGHFLQWEVWGSVAVTKGGIRKFPEGRYAEIELTTDDRYTAGSLQATFDNSHHNWAQNLLISSRCRIEC